MHLSQKVLTFLHDFKIKMKIWGVIFRDDRGKNLQCLLDLDIRPVKRLEVLNDLVAEDYSEGPIQEKLFGGADMWIFGKLVRQKEMYIKITMGIEGANVICISFHLAAYPMKYPLKKV